MIALGSRSPKLDAVRALQTKRGRVAAGTFAVEGPTLLAEALAAGARPESVYVTHDGAVRLAEIAPLPCETFLIADRAMARLSDLETSPGILAIFPQRTESIASVLQAEKPAVLLAGVADPGNAGTLLRTAEIFGFDRAVITDDGVEPYNAKAVRATMGAVFRLHLAVASAAEVDAAAKRYGYTIVAAVRGGEPLPGFVFPKRSLVAIGNERRGVAGSLGRYDRAVEIPHAGSGESLNAASAGAIIFYAFSQQCERSASNSQSPEKP